MARYRKVPVEIEATRWFKNGDHPKDDCHLIAGPAKDKYSSFGEYTEGKIVKRYNKPGSSKRSVCSQCGETLAVHGWIKTLEGGHIVCPGDWIITTVEGEHYPCKPDIFAKTYEKVED